MSPLLRLYLKASCVFAISILTATLTCLAHADQLQQPDSDKKIQVFLFAGQSNMEGRANGRKLSQRDQIRLRDVQNRIQLAYNHEPVRPLGVVSPAKEIAEIYRREQIFGPELFFGIALAEAMPEEKFLFIKRTEGSTSLHGCWNPDWKEADAALMGERNDPKLYQVFINYVRDVLKGYSPDQYELCAMLWVQGETDSKVPEAASTYGTTLCKLIMQVRLDTSNKSLPFMLFQVGSSQVVEGMQRCSTKLPHVTLIPQSLNPDSPHFYKKMKNGHYNHKGMKKLGTRFAETFLNTYKPLQQ